MSFENIDFSQMFHDGFRLDRAALVVHLAFDNRIQELAESALLALLIEQPMTGRPPPPPPDDEVQEAFYRIQLRLDCRDAPTAEQLVAGCSTDLEETHVALQRSLTRRHLGNELVRRAVAGDAEAQEAICWESFTAGTLRGDAIRAMSVAIAAGAERDPPTDRELSRARQHLLARHGEVAWPSLFEKLTCEWGISPAVVSTALERFALALRHGSLS